MKSIDIFKKLRLIINEKMGVEIACVEMPNHKVGKLDQIEHDLLLYDKYKTKINELEKEKKDE